MRRDSHGNMHTPVRVNTKHTSSLCNHASGDVGRGPHSVTEKENEINKYWPEVERREPIHWSFTGGFIGEESASQMLKLPVFQKFQVNFLSFFGTDKRLSSDWSEVGTDRRKMPGTDSDLDDAWLAFQARLDRFLVLPNLMDAAEEKEIFFCFSLSLFPSSAFNSSLLAGIFQWIKGMRGWSWSCLMCIMTELRSM